MQGFVDVGNMDYLLHLLDITKKAAQPGLTQLDDELDETITYEDSEIDREKIDLNASEIRDIYVGLITLLSHYLNFQIYLSVYLYVYPFIHFIIQIFQLEMAPLLNKQC